MGAAVLNAVIKRAGIKPEQIQDVTMGCAFPEGEQGMNVARLTVLRAGLPDTIPAVTMNRFCSSGLEAAATWRPSTGTWLTLQHTELRINGPTLSPAEAAHSPSEWVQYSAPRHSSTVFGAWEFLPRWQFSLAKHWIGSMTWYQDSAHRAFMYRQLDVRLAYRLPPTLARGEIALTARNIDGADQTYANGTSLWGNQVFGSLSLEL